MSAGRNIEYKWYSKLSTAIRYAAAMLGHDLDIGINLAEVPDYGRSHHVRHYALVLTSPGSLEYASMSIPSLLSHSSLIPLRYILIALKNFL